MALKVGDLYVSLSANVSQFTKSMAQVAEDVGKVARKLKMMSNDVATMGAPLAAAIGAAVAVAAKTNAQVGAELDKMKRAFDTAATEIAVAFLPALREITKAVTGLVAWMQQLDPELKAQLVSWAALALKITGGAFAFSKVAMAAGVAADAAAMAFKVIGAVVKASFLGPVLAAAAVVGVLVLAAGALREAWDQNLGGIREKAAAVWKWIGDAAKTVFDFFRNGARRIGEWFGAAFETVIAISLAWAENLIRTVAQVSKYLGKDIDQVADGMVRGLRGLAEDMMNPGVLLAESAEFALAAWDFTASGVKKNMADVMSYIQPMLDKVQGMIPDLNGTGARLIDTTEYTVKMSGKTDVNQVHKLAADAMGPSKALTAGREALDKIAVKAAKEAAKAAAELRDAMNSVAEGAVQSLIGEFGALGAVVNSARDAFKSIRAAGGGTGDAAAGAMAAGGAAVFSAGMSFWSDIIAAESRDGAGGNLQAALKTMTDTFGVLADAFGMAYSTARDLGAVVWYYARDVVMTWSPALMAFGEALKGLAPAFVVAGEFASALAKVALSITGGFLATPLLADAGKFLFDAMKFAAQSVLSAAANIMHAWNVAVHNLAIMMAGLGQQGAANSLMGMIKSTQPLLEALAALENMTYDSAKAKAAEILATYDAVEATRELTAELLNVPEGFKVERARFNATTGAASDIVHTQIFGAGQGTNIATMNVYTTDPEDFARQLERRRYRKSGFDAGDP